MHGVHGDADVDADIDVEVKCHESAPCSDTLMADSDVCSVAGCIP